jgi:Tfp pilus assembly protein PilN
MRIPVNLATKPMETHRRFLTFSGVSVGFSALVFFMLGWHVYSARKAESSFQLQSEQATREIRLLTDQRRQLDSFFMRPENAKLHDRASFINTIIDAQSFNWTRMFMDLEHILPGGVHVINIEPQQVNGEATLKLTVGAESEEAKNRFLQALEKSAVFSDIELINVKEGKQEAGGDTLTLELTFAYSGA